jgi:hypothetical protein
MQTQTDTYNTLEDIALRKEQLIDAIEHDGEQIGKMWNELFKKREDYSSKGEYIATLVSTTITAVDVFLLVRKLMKNYSGLLNFFGREKKKKRKQR